MKLQVALDYTSLEPAVQLAKAVVGVADIIEVGTPLIKAEGMRAVSQMKKLFDADILADMKTADVGSLEVQLAADAGADWTTVMGAAPLETIRAAIDRAHEVGIKICIDTIGLDNGWVDRLDDLGADLIVVHKGIDEGGEWISVPKTKTPLGLAGGLEPESVSRLVKCGAKIEVIIVGRYITKAKNPLEAARNIRRCFDGIQKNEPRPF